MGSWNSLHTGSAGSDGPSGKLWYEGDFYATLGLGFGGGVSLGTTYTAYTSPNNMFSTVKEIAFKLGVDDTAYLGRAALKPYALLAFEMDTAPGLGQADAGDNAGKYLELGIAPGYSVPAASLAFPVKVGLSVERLLRALGGGQQVRLLQRGGPRDGAARRHHQLRHLERPRRRRIPGARRHDQGRSTAARTQRSSDPSASVSPTRQSAACLSACRA